MKIGIIGCGNISPIYIKNCKAAPNLQVAALADLNLDLARRRAAEFKIARVCTLPQLLKDPSIKLVVNLTPPKAHFGLTCAALKAGKHVYSEKALAVEREDGRRILALAKSRGLRVGCAPDTFLGPGLQTCRRALDKGLIGRPVAASACFLSHGPEHWHPNPAFFYAKGAGPLLDMGPYYLTALVSLLGPIKRVTSCSGINIPKRRVTSQPHYGQIIKVQTPGHIAGALEFASGLLANFTCSFEVWSHRQPGIEIYGTDGSLSFPDPNMFGGAVSFCKALSNDWKNLPLIKGSTENRRGLGVEDMVQAIEKKRPIRASGELAYHVLDVMEGLLEASKLGRHVKIKSTVKRPDPIP